MRGYTHYFWDFDGTLYDTYGLITDLCMEVLAHCGISAPRDEVLRLAKGSMGDVFTAYCQDADEHELRGLYNQASEKAGLSGMQLYPGAEKFLRMSRLQGAQHYLYTHRDNAAIAALKRDGLYPLFTDFITSEDGFPAKPAPDALNHLMQRYSLNRRDCVMVGDRAMDLDAAKNAGMDGVLFDPDGFYHDYPAQHRFADYVSMQTLLKVTAPT
ncbi:MAG: HAD-IA family hydrolase [Christensenellales bacterium]|jgi:HAD superfamily hydrolase (TIGR01549 family)